MKVRLGSSDLSLDEAIQRATRVIAKTFSADEHPDLQHLRYVILKQGKLVTKAAKVWGIRDRNKREFLHNTLVLETLRVTKKRGWELETHHSITLESDDEIRRLFDFLAAIPELEGDGEFMVINAENIDQGAGQIIKAISKSEQTAELMERILSWAQSDRDATDGLIRLSGDDPVRSQSLIAALNYGRYRRALDEFKELVEQNQVEHVYQAFLEEHYWMFGSEYAELIQNRNIIKDQQFDFPLRRTVDGYLEIIDIKRPFREVLFRKDKRGYFPPTSELNEAVAQVDDYLANVDADQFRIVLHEELETEKVRGKVVIGRDGDATQIQALRRLNARTNRIEVITFDQLIRIAERILEIMIEQNPLLQTEQVSEVRETSTPRSVRR